MGEVYLAEDVRLLRLVAIKVLSGDLTEDPYRLRRFSQEARAVSALSHPGIVTLYEIGEEAGQPYIVTEFVDGISLRKRLSEGPIDLTEARHIAVQVASALQKAHSAGIVHGDIKPDNIIVSREGAVKVADFGLAKLEKSKLPKEIAAEFQTQRGVVVGTIDYMSPEQVAGQAVDARRDLWSLGVVVYEMVTGHLPFAGKTRIETISLILQEEPPRLTTYVDVPGQLEHVVSKALRKNPDERYQSASEFLADLQSVRQSIEPRLEHLPPDVTTQTPFATSSRRPRLEEVHESTPSSSSAEYLGSTIKRHRLALLAAATVSLLAAIALGYLYLPGKLHQSAIQSEVSEATTTAESSIRDRYYGIEPIVVALPEGKSVTGYDGNEVIAVAQTGKQNLIRGLQAPELAGLKDYVVQTYPVPSPEALERIKENKTDRLLITEASKNAAFTNVFQFIARIRALVDQRRLSIDLTVSSLPDGATFDLWASVGPHRTTTTNNMVDNVYRGFYRYKVTKGGFKPIEDSLNLVDSDGRRLDCYLQETSEQDGPHPCKLR